MKLPLGFLERLNMNRLTGTHQERVEWYIKSFIHTLNNSAGAIHGFVELSQGGADSGITEAYGSWMDILESFGTVQDVARQYDNLREAYSEFQQIAKQRVSERFFNSFEHRLASVQEIFNGIESVVKDPGYEDDVTIERFVETVVHKVQDEHAGRFISFEVYAKAVPPKHHVSPFDLYLLFWNLLTNAVQAAQQGTVELDIEHKPRAYPAHATISMQNPGVIPEENLRKVRRGEPFTTKPKGTMQGLCDIRDVVQKYEGVLRVSSENGTVRFEVDLPYRRCAAPGANYLWLRR